MFECHAGQHQVGKRTGHRQGIVVGPRIQQKRRYPALCRQRPGGIAGNGELMQVRAVEKEPDNTDAFGTIAGARDGDEAVAVRAAEPGIEEQVRRRNRDSAGPACRDRGGRIGGAARPGKERTFANIARRLQPGDRVQHGLWPKVELLLDLPVGDLSRLC